MTKVLLIAVAAALIVGAAFTGSAGARERGDRSDRAALTANQIVAGMDARTARIKADLRLTPEQEKNWPGLESAVRDISKNRAERAQQKESDDVIAYLKSNAKCLGERSADVKKLADAAQPLYESLDEQQKRRFARDLIRLSRERDIDERDLDR